MASSPTVDFAVSHSEQFARVNNVIRAECCHRLYDGLMAGMCQDDGRESVTYGMLVKCTDYVDD